MTLTEQYKAFIEDNKQPLPEVFHWGTSISDMLDTPWASCPDCGYTLNYDITDSGRVEMCNVYCEDCDFTEEIIN
jgi:hypothetical protein